MAIDYVPPLPQGMPIVDPDTGAPTHEFMQWWQQMFGNQDTLDSDVTGKADAATEIIAGTGLSGGGDLSQDRTLTADEQAILDEISSTQGAVLYRGASDWSALSPGTSGHFLKTNGAAANPEWAAAGGGGGGSLAFIERQTFSAVSAVDIDLPDDYESFRIEYTALPSGSTEIVFRITEDGFSTVKSGSSDYNFVLMRYAGSFGGGRSAANSHINTKNFADSGRSTGLVDVMFAKETTRPARLIYKTDYDNGAPGLSWGEGDYIGSNNAINGIRILPTSGTITGFYKIWGLSD